MREPGPDAVALLAAPTWRDVWFGALIQWLIFMPLLSVLLFLGGVTREGASLGLTTALFSPLYSAPVGAVVTVVLGVPLAMLLARLLRRDSHWRAHLAAFLGLGFTVATVLIHLWMLSIGRLWDSASWWDSMWILFVPIVSAAALSVGAGWSIAWRGALVRQRRAETQLALVAD